MEDGDVIRIGECQIKFVTDVISEQSATLCGGNISTLKPNTLKPGNPKAAEKPTACLKVINGDNPGATIKITKGLTTLGKSGLAVAAITRRANGGFYIIDVESTNDRQSLINGKPLSSEAIALNDHDVIEVAGTSMKFNLGPTPSQIAEDNLAIQVVKL